MKRPRLLPRPNLVGNGSSSYVIPVFTNGRSWRSNISPYRVPRTVSIAKPFRMRARIFWMVVCIFMDDAFIFQSSG